MATRRIKFAQEANVSAELGVARVRDVFGAFRVDGCIRAIAQQPFEKWAATWTAHHAPSKSPAGNNLAFRNFRLTIAGEEHAADFALVRVGSTRRFLLHITDLRYRAGGRWRAVR